MQPKIFVSGVPDSRNYIAALAGAGARVEAAYLPDAPLSAAQCVDYDGLVFAGGVDLHPARYGEGMNGSRKIDPLRDERELALARAFLRTGKPILGICRGHQLLNVLFGGTLIQHLETTPQHMAEGDTVHAITAEEGSFLHSLYGAHFSVNSNHHQAVGIPGEGIRVNAAADCDGTAEAFAHRSLPVFGVQFHPERMCLERAREDTVDGLAVFRWFSALCAK